MFLIVLQLFEYISESYYVINFCVGLIFYFYLSGYYTSFILPP